MLPKHITEKAKVLLQEGKLSKRGIAKQLGISRVTLDRIQSKMLFPEGKPEESQIKIVHFNESDDFKHIADRPTYARCPGCGGMQQDHVPCLVCITRKQKMDEYDHYMAELLGPPVTHSPLSRNTSSSPSPNGKP